MGLEGNIKKTEQVVCVEGQRLTKKTAHNLK